MSHRATALPRPQRGLGAPGGAFAGRPLRGGRGGAALEGGVAAPSGPCCCQMGQQWPEDAQANAGTLPEHGFPPSCPWHLLAVFPVAAPSSFPARAAGRRRQQVRSGAGTHGGGEATELSGPWLWFASMEARLVAKISLSRR
ncbi:unnamed protein product [Prorocentrum cordatum]|uniref:Uncharacterized protein n=1 Tax=Prorocentrum cordatum TaxID=2364126 RepID=A0ABN9SPG3_9DINO|nr:unnamed protein product [Polarella glacialis]